MTSRIKIVKSNYDEFNLTILEILHYNKLISKNYSDKCLGIDRWFVTRERRRFKNIIPEDFMSDDPYKTIWFRAIVQAILDAGMQRPCDLGFWKSDLPPGGKIRCNPSLHICAASAIEFLTKVDENTERFIGLSPGTIEEFIDIAKMKKSEAFTSPFIFNF